MRYLMLSSIAMTWFIIANTLAVSQEAGFLEERSDMLAFSGFECAVLGAHAGSENVPVDEVTRLAMLGFESIERKFSDFREAFSNAERIEKNGPLGSFMAERTPAFFAGMLFAQAANKINLFVEKEYPADAATDFDTLMWFRGNAAYSEFRRRNCGLIGD